MLYQVHMSNTIFQFFKNTLIHHVTFIADASGRSILSGTGQQNSKGSKEH